MSSLFGVLHSRLQGMAEFACLNQQITTCFPILSLPLNFADWGIPCKVLCSATRNAGKGSRNQDKDGIIIIGPNQWEICYFLKVLILPSCWLLHSYFATLGPYLFIEISDHSFCWFTGLSGPWPSTTYKTFIIV